MSEKEWISVKERLPHVEKGGLTRVLIASSNHCENGLFDYDAVGEIFLQSIRTAEGDYVKVWMSDVDRVQRYPEHITHWMPLPPRPKTTLQGAEE